MTETATTPPLSRKEVIRIAARVFGISTDDLTGPGRDQRFVRARFVAAVLMRELVPNASLDRIGDTLNRDHTTILHALRKAPRLIEHDVAFSVAVAECRRQIADRPLANRTQEAAGAVLEAARHVGSQEPQKPARAQPPSRETQIRIPVPGEAAERAWFEENNRRAMRAFAKVHPELLPVAMREAAE